MRAIGDHSLISVTTAAILALAASIAPVHAQTAADAALNALTAILGDGDALLVKGSNSVGLSALVRALAASPAASAVSREGV